ncbi:MAG: radical SAM protein [Candidatus Brennerbacteria bacterium]|nr:radical SAM protein [Candidatus Brennerbacteria bacterium]
MRTIEFPTVIGDTIIVPDGHCFLIYGQGVKKVARSSNLCAEVMENLIQAGFFREVCSEVIPAPQKLSNLMLLLSKRCPLRCVYCYANTGASNELMSVELADKAIACYLALNHKNPRVTLFGAGEPTSAAQVIKHVVAKYNTRVRWTLTTSGVMSVTLLEWLIDYNVGITFSIDGPPSIQDRLRPLKGGFPSSSHVERSLRIWKKRSSNPLSVRTTLTSDSIPRIGEILEYFEDLGVDRIHLEPMYGLGRGKNINCAAPIEVEQWVDAIIHALEWARRASKKVRVGELTYFFQGATHRSYCGPMGGSTLVVNHRGELTACSEVDDGLNKKWPSFFIGNIGDGFVVDGGKAEYLASRRTTNMKQCHDCFVRNLCRGGCAHKGLTKTGDLFTPDPTHCAFMRAIIPRIIKRVAEGAYLK